MSINYAWIFLIAKSERTADIGDYRPTSLANCSYKIVAKCLTNRIKGEIENMVDESQETFI